MSVADPRMQTLLTSGTARAMQVMNYVQGTGGGGLVRTAQSAGGVNQVPQINRTGVDVEGLLGLRVGSFNYHQDHLVGVDDPRNLDLSGFFRLSNSMSVSKDVNVGGDAPVMGYMPAASDVAANPCTKLTSTGELNLGCEGTVSMVSDVAQERGPCTLSGTARNALSPVNQGKGNDNRRQTAKYGALPDGALAVCKQGAPGAVVQANGTLGGAWVALQRFRKAGDACGWAGSAETEGSTAIDPTDHQNLICKGSQYLRTSAMTSNMVLQDMRNITVPADENGYELPKPSCVASGGLAGQPRVTLESAEEASLAMYPTSTMVSGVFRYAKEKEGTNDKAWSVHIRRLTDRQAVAGEVVASTFCYYATPAQLMPAPVLQPQPQPQRQPEKQLGWMLPQPPPAPPPIDPYAPDKPEAPPKDDAVLKAIEQMLKESEEKKKREM